MPMEKLISTLHYCEKKSRLRLFRSVLLLLLLLLLVVVVVVVVVERSRYGVLD